MRSNDVKKKQKKNWRSFCVLRINPSTLGAKCVSAYVVEGDVRKRPLLWLGERLLRVYCASLIGGNFLSV